MYAQNITLEEVTEVTEKFNKQFGTSAFIRVEKQGYIVFNYAFQTPEIFPAINSNDEKLNREYSILRECRGLTFCSKTGKILARKFEKFFNMNQMEETKFENINWDRPHIVMNKLDGSMFTPMLLNNQIVWTTKMGITDFSIQVEEFVKINSQFRYNDLANWAIANNKTPIFEWCSRQNKIVVDYPIDELVLTAVRDNITGRYSTIDELYQFAMEFSIPLVEVFENVADINKFLQVNSHVVNFEGFVIWFTDNDQKVKIKLDWYLERHRAVDDLSSEKKVISLVLNDEIDDIISLLDKNDQDLLTVFQTNFWRNVNKYIETLQNEVVYFYNDFMKNNIETDAKLIKRNFALKVLANINKENHKIYFGYFDNVNFHFKNFIINYIHKNLSTRKDIDNVRYIFNVNWSRKNDE